MSISRRDFLKTSAAATAVICSNPLMAKESKIKSIPHASNLGAFYADVDENGKIVKIRPQVSDKDSKYPGNEAWIDRVYSDTRIKYPCVRKSYLEGKNTP